MGTHAVTVTVSDEEADPISCSTSVTVVDTTPPTVDCSVSLPLLWPPNHDLLDVGFSASASDACDSHPTVQVTVYGDEDDEEPTGDGVHSPDAKMDPNLRLRSERKGHADGRVCLIIVTATDASGNTAFDCCTVVVPKSQSKAHVDSANAQAATAEAYCLAFGTAPPGYFLIGDGPVIGPKQ